MCNVTSMFMVAAKFMETKERESKGFQKIENTSFWFNVKLGITDVMIIVCSRK
jgi:hypothetical protein